MISIKYNFIIFLIAFTCLYSCKHEPKEVIKILSNEITQNQEDVVFGEDSCSNTIFIYASYNCKFCRFLFSRTIPKIENEFLQNGKVKIVIKWVEFSEDPQSLYALHVGSCIYKFGNYKPFHKLLLTNPAVVTTNDFSNLVDDIMLDNNNIAECILSDNNYYYLKENIKEFRKNNISGTPAIVINKHLYSGYIPYEKFKHIIKKEFKL